MSSNHKHIMTHPMQWVLSSHLKTWTGFSISISDPFLSLLMPPSPSRSLSTGSKSTSSGGSNTPVRKISAHDFEKGGLTKPIVSCIDGTPTFLSPSSLNTSSELTGQIRKKSRNDLHTLNESELMMELVKDIYSEVDPKGLCHKILQNVGILTGADRCSLFLVKGDPKKEALYLVIKSSILLFPLDVSIFIFILAFQVSNLFDVSSTSTVEDMSEREIRVSSLFGIYLYLYL